MKNSLLAVTASLFAALASNSFAHHSSAPHFDHDNPITVEGRFSHFRMVNPHAYFYFDVEEDGVVNEWRCELSSATQLTRWGWTEDMFNEGQLLKVSGSPARREGQHCYTSSIELANGTVISRNGAVDGVQTAIAEPQVAVERSFFLEDGRSNIEGAWVTRSFGRRGAEGIRPQYTATDVGEAVMVGYEMEFDDPILRCHPLNIFNAWNHDQHINEIYVGEDTITLQYGFMDFVRTIHMNLDDHPANITASTGGHSIGRWEGDTLVVDTIGFEQSVLNHFDGMSHSDQMHVTERFRVDADTGYLIRDYYINDPLFLVGEVHGQDLMTPSATGYSPYNCVELSGDNNIRSGDQ